MKRTHAPRKPVLTLTIEKAIYGGAGLAHVPESDAARDGKAVFVPMTLPGEVVEVELQAEKKQFATAALLRVLEPSPARITPRCRHYGVCGGCDYQHTDAETQLALKMEILRESLLRAGIGKLQVDLPEIRPHAAAPWEYRNRIRLHLALLDGRLRLGYTRAQSNQVVPLQECPIAAPLLVRAALAMESLAYESLAMLDVLTTAEEAELFCTAEEDALQVVLLPRDADAAPLLLELAKALRERVPELHSLAWRGEMQPGIRYTIGAEEYRVPPGAFFQANRNLLPELLHCVTAGRSGGSAWDLYSGVGLFARILARSFAHVTAVESAPASIAALRGNLSGLPAECSMHTADTLAFLVRAAQRKSAAAGSITPDLVVLDPPRAGLGAEICRALAAIAPHEIAYVSCDPATMARDLAALLGADYRIESLDLLDMFPQTSHIEAVAVLRK